MTTNIQVFHILDIPQRSLLSLSLFLIEVHTAVETMLAKLSSLKRASPYTIPSYFSFPE